MKFILGCLLGTTAYALVDAFLEYKRAKLKQNQEIIEKVDALNEHLAECEKWNKSLNGEDFGRFVLTYDFLERDIQIRKILSQIPNRKKHNNE